MSRIIKFRAWDKNTKKMLYENVWVPFHPSDGLTSVPKTFINPFELEIMQFTGLRDKNRDEIYEGDIVTGKPPEFMGNCIGVVKYGGLSFSFIGTTDSESLLEYNDHEWFYTVTNPDIKELPEIEIIGNIYSNPELIKSH